ncbi:hypothetical protein NA57DRAFT_49166 [Rhizodiscina lignyota]|uniref:C2H2-type domain-containing protein n=1 Tax=Rhizodiscina lignyota TaxID=1504668 RepID=A0A9P4I4J4_9PEZI|nr:hypothetical protein NA57DRAFT_49166 [Rhizodiscina lignyota]
MAKSDSELSSLSSEAFEEDIKGEERSISPADPYDDSARPSKRQRTGGHTSWDAHAGANSTTYIPPITDDADISSDTEGSVPGSPTHPVGLGVQDRDEETLAGEQITTCKWEGCPAGDLGNMDKLVEHLHDAHILARQKKYSCEWVDCSRKGIPHASGYALRAHMRSHTREKPFYCSLPECDRSFTRSDALAKHMRTVHETEALRPSDPVPKHHSSNPQNKFQRLRLTVKAPNGGAGSDKSTPASPSATSTTQHYPPTSDYDNSNVIFVPDAHGDSYTRQFPPDIRWTEREAAMSPKDLLHLLQRQLEWASQDAEELKAEVERLEAQRKEEWMAKELVLENAMEAEMAVLEERDGEKTLKLDGAVLQRIERDALRTRNLQLENGTAGTPWWRQGGKWAAKADGAESGASGGPMQVDGDVEMGEGEDER